MSNHGTGDQPAAEHSVEFPEARGQPIGGFGLHLGELAGGRRHTLKADLRGGCGA